MLVNANFLLLLNTEADNELATGFFIFIYFFNNCSLLADLPCEQLAAYLLKGQREIEIGKSRSLVENGQIGSAWLVARQELESEHFCVEY